MMIEAMNPRWFLSFLLLAEAALAAGNHPLPIPQNVVPEIIAEDLRFNGSPMRIVQFQTLDAEGVARFYRRFFKEKAQEGRFTESELEGIRVIGAMMGKELINVELKPKGKIIRVLVSSLQPERLELPEKLAKDMPKMQGTQVFQHQESRDGPKKNRMVFMTNQYSVESNTIYLREHYLRLGWTRISDHTVKTTVQRQLIFGKDNRRLHVDLQRTNPKITTIILNEMWE